MINVSARDARADRSNALAVSGLTKRFGSRTVVDNVDLQVPQGCAFGYLGPNGAGKTTLIRMVLGLTTATAGSMTVLGHPVPAERELALARVGAIVDEPRFHHYLSGRQNLQLLAAARDREADDRIEPTLERVGLRDRAADRVAGYSMGMRQRLGVAACLLGDPDLLILDEPMNGLDPAGMTELRQLIRNLIAEGRTVILSSHLLDEVEKTCDMVAVVDNGRIVAQGLSADVVRGATRVLRIRCDDPTLARQIIMVHDTNRTVTAQPDGIAITVPAGTQPDADRAAGFFNTMLIQNGVTVYALDTPHATLEERFLEITSPLGRRS
jgi:ABC-2 type transport system ATP-binding protein